MFENILVAVDRSPAATRAVECARGLAKLTDSTIILLNAYPKLPEFLGEPNLSDAIAHYLEEAKEIVTPWPIL